MNILILGGTQFVGRHMVQAALAHGHQVTLFNRGRTNLHLFPDVEKLHGDRDANLEALHGRRWDAVIDVSGYRPDQVKATAGLLANNVGHYTFISSIAVYRDFGQAGLDETAPIHATVEPGNAKQYGPNKALSEGAAEIAMPGRVLTIRPGIIVGPHDPTDRLTSWVRRIPLGGEMLCPGKPDSSVQIIDARDLADWMISLIQSRTAGCFNATGPAHPLTFGTMLNECKATESNNSRFTWVDEAFLLDQNLNLSSDLPLWIPSRETNYAGFFSINCQKALRAGLKFRPLSDTARDILDATTANGDSQPVTGCGLTPSRETGLLNLWKAKVCA